MTTRWPRDAWLDAQFDDASLKPNERVVAYAYARYAGASDRTWCSWNELKKRTGIKSWDTISKAITGLVNGGWLVETEKARQHQSTIYRLSMPDIQLSSSRSTEESQVSKNWSADEIAENGPALQNFESSSPFPGPHLSNENSKVKNGGTLPPDPLRPMTPQAPSSTDQHLPDQAAGPAAHSSPKPGPPPAHATAPHALAS